MIVDDVSYFEEPFFQDGPVAVAINEVVAKGVAYFSAAGNDNLVAGGKDIASWETPAFRDAAGCPAQLEAATLDPTTLGKADHCLDFDPGAGEDDTFGITVEKEADAERRPCSGRNPGTASRADIDAYLLDAAGKPLLKGADLVGSTDDNVGEEGTQKPVEFFSWKNEGPETEVQLAINRCFGKLDRRRLQSRRQLADQTAGEGDPARERRRGERHRVPGIGRAATSSAPRSTATPARPGRSASARSGSASATAPERLLLARPGDPLLRAGRRRTPAPPLEQTIAKPDVVASDCGRTTFFVPTEAPRGSSASAAPRRRPRTPPRSPPSPGRRIPR